MVRRVVLAALVVALLAAPWALAAGPDLPDNASLRAAAATAQHFLAAGGARALGVSGREALVPRSVNHDHGTAAVRFDTVSSGARVWGGEVIVHVDLASGTVGRIVNAHRHARSSMIRPQVSESDAAAIAWAAMAPAAAPDRAPRAELVYYPVGDGDRLAWAVDAFFENGVEEPRARMTIVDAQTGAVIDSWDNLHTAKPGSTVTYTPGTGTAAVGTAKTLYLGQLSLDTERYADGKYGMVAHTAGNSYTTDLKNRTNGTGTLFVDADNVWGNFTNADRATAGTDAHLGMAYTFSYYLTRFGRNGIFDDGKGVYSRVHYGRNYNNAFWSDSCKCMTYGDGDGSVLSPLVSLDVAAHEMSHGVCAATADLVYSGQSGGLNESNSDIFAAAVEFYAANAEDPGDWWIGEEIYTPATPGDALRYMDDPRRDGRSIDHLSLYTSTMDVHYSSGLANNWFYLLSAGGTNRTSGLSVAGIGIGKAEQIWYRALSMYMTSTTTFAGARTATVNAASDLYGSSSTEVQRVKDAWNAVGVL